MHGNTPVCNATVRTLVAISTGQLGREQRCTSQQPAAKVGAASGRSFVMRGVRTERGCRQLRVGQLGRAGGDARGTVSRRVDSPIDVPRSRPPASHSPLFTYCHGTLNCT
uniref:Secreted protein n=1 Tax=Ascaris lumbricoides TaxID=6252 RepID=A0A0M3IB78_ASCLU